MDRMKAGKTSPESPPPLRLQILKVLSDAETDSTEALNALNQCKAFIEDQIIVERGLRDCGLKSSNFTVDAVFEFRYEIAKGRTKFGAIYKGWEDSTLRVGAFVDVPRWDGASEVDPAYSLLNECAALGLIMTIQNKDTKTAALQFDAVLGADGFNAESLVKAIRRLEAGVKRAKALFRG